MITQPNTQFTSLLQTELKRLETIVAQNERSYPVAFRPYIFARQLQPKKVMSTYTGFLSFVRMVQFFF